MLRICDIFCQHCLQNLLVFLQANNKDSLYTHFHSTYLFSAHWHTKCIVAVGTTLQHPNPNTRGTNHDETHRKTAEKTEWPKGLHIDRAHDRCRNYRHPGCYRNPSVHQVSFPSQQLCSTCRCEKCKDRHGRFLCRVAALSQLMQDRHFLFLWQKL